jgi:TonB-linked SusC/RagA family outer membrane protein
MRLNCLRRMMIAFAGLLLFAGAAVEAQGQAAVITGRVTSDQGQPIAGANVIIPELNVSVGTNQEGRYTITIPAARVANQNVTMRARAIGYVPASINIVVRPEQRTADFALRTDVNRLAEVVVTGVSGATEQAKTPFKVERLTAEDMPVPQADPLRQIQGKVPGARIVQASGRPGQTPAVILRGPTSINGQGRGQSPLFIVDGVVLNAGLGDINPEDIESVEIVKGAAAASLYGARAGNGAIQIRTRSGRTGSEGLRFNLRTEYGQADVEGDIRIAQNHALLTDETGQLFCVGGSNDRSCSRRINWENEALRINDIPIGDVLTLAPAPFPIDPGSSVPFAHQRFVFQAARWPGSSFNPVEQFVNPEPTYATQFDMTGRFGGTGVFASVNRTDEGGAIEFLNGNQRTSGRLNVDQQIGDKWNAGLRMYYARAVEDGVQFESASALGLGTSTSPFFRLTRQPRIIDLSRRDSKGRLFTRSALTTGGAQNQNPLTFLEQILRNDITDRFLGGMTITYNPLTWLELVGNYGYDSEDSKADEQVDKGFITTGFQSNNSLGYYASSAQQQRSYNASIGATGRWTFGDALNTRTSLNYSQSREDASGNSLFGRGLSVIGLFDADNAIDQTLKSIGSFTQSVRSIGFVLTEAIDFRDRYIVEGLVRRDGSSLFGRANRWKTFGRGSVAWRLSQEPWWFISPLDEFKLRYSRGSAGGRPNFTAQYETYTLTAAGPSPAILGNRFLKPEITIEDEFGLDAQLLGKYLLSLTYAKSDTRDQILLVPAPAATAFTNQWQNAGTVQNKTWEASLNIPIITQPNLNWSTRLIYDRNRAVITKLIPPPYGYGTGLQATAEIFFAREGERLGTFYGRKFIQSCSDLPGAFAQDCGGPTSSFQVNDDGWLVWVGSGNSWTEGVTKNLWGTVLACPTGANQGTLACNTTPFTYPLHWGMPIILRDSVGVAQVVPLGNALPDYKWGISTNFDWRGFTAYALFDAAHGNEVWNQARHWSYLDFLNADQDQGGKTVETAKPLGYYFRAGAPESVGSGGFYDLLAPNSLTVEDASYVKLRELAIGYRLGRIGNMRGDWRINLIGRNLKTWTDYKGWDPEVGSFAGADRLLGGPASGQTAGSAAINAIDAFGFPILRTYTLSVQTTF